MALFFFFFFLLWPVLEVEGERGKGKDREIHVVARLSARSEWWVFRSVWWHGCQRDWWWFFLWFLRWVSLGDCWHGFHLRLLAWVLVIGMVVAWWWVLWLWWWLLAGVVVGLCGGGWVFLLGGPRFLGFLWRLVELLWRLGRRWNWVWCVGGGERWCKERERERVIWKWVWLIFGFCKWFLFLDVCLSSGLLRNHPNFEKVKDFGIWVWFVLDFCKWVFFFFFFFVSLFGQWRWWWFQWKRDWGREVKIRKRREMGDNRYGFEIYYFIV